MVDQALHDLLKALASADVDQYTADFHVLEAFYDSADGQSKIRSHILVPKALSNDHGSSSRPLMIRIHGGYLITGSSLYPPWFTPWILEYARKSAAIIASPNYRLMPEANGMEILDDMNAFWNWIMEGNVDKVLHENGFKFFQSDLNRILLMGESAGGYLAMQLALSHPSTIRAVITAYPMLDICSQFFTSNFSKPIIGVANRPVEILEDHLQTIRTRETKQRPTVTEADPPDRLELSFSIVQNGRYLEFFGDDKQLFPMERISDFKDCDGENLGARLPHMFIFHGQNDSAVPVDGTLRFSQKLVETRPMAKVHLEIQPGDHGFDFGATLETPWLENGLREISESWLGESHSIQA